MSVPVLDPYGVGGDLAMPNLALAIDAEYVQRRMPKDLKRLMLAAGSAQLQAIRVTRHKPGRRCVIEYDVRIDGQTVITLIGKTRRNRPGRHALQRQLAFWQAGFDSACPDGVSVPEPIGVIKTCEVWVQRKADGFVASACFEKSDAGALLERIAFAAHKLHRLGGNIEKTRVHAMADELHILHERFDRLAENKPHLRARLSELLTACDALAATVVPPAVLCGIHRDFYGDQILVDGERLTLIDFDLYCAGDPAVDIGNFIAHMTEQGLREHGDPAYFQALEASLATRYLSLAPAIERARLSHAIRVYVTLTLLRHVSLSSELPERQHLTECLLDLCEQRIVGAQAC